MNPLRHIGLRHIHLEVTDSTNSRAAELAHDPRYGGTVVTSDLQAQGRGQYGRVWQSPPGANVLLSALLFPPPALRRPVVLTAFAAVAVSDTVFQISGREARIKWPNDVLVDGKKVSGILIECGDSGRESPYCVVGIGLNVNLSTEDVRQMQIPEATSLSQLVGRCLDMAEVTRRLIQNLDADYGRMMERDTSDLECKWVHRLGLVGELVSAERMDATETQGRLLGLGFDAVIIERNDGTIVRLLPEELRHLR